MANISDFGEAMLLDMGIKTLSSLSANKTKTLTGTPTYLAPELKRQLAENKYD
jgi:hypothetical protein